jgi:hypothetical protein
VVVMLPMGEAMVSGARTRVPVEREGVGRRNFIVGAAGLTGAAVGSGWVAAPGASAHPSTSHHHLSTAAARPIPGGIQPFGPGTELFHVLTPGQGEGSTITDFKGHVGVAVIDGHGTGSNVAHAFEIDIRFMDGTFVGLDGRRSFGTFAFY